MASVGRMSHRLPFPPRGGWPAEERSVLDGAITPDSSAGLWRTLESELDLTVGGRVVFLAVAAVAGAVGCGGFFVAVANLMSNGIHSDQMAAAVTVWTGVATAALFAGGLAVVWAVDGAFRCAHEGFRRLRR